MFVVSSTGDGDPPENFESFWLALHETPPDNLTFALLGLGDSNYTRYGGFPEDFLGLLTRSGAKSFYEYQVQCSVVCCLFDQFTDTSLQKT